MLENFLGHAKKICLGHARKFGSQCQYSVLLPAPAPAPASIFYMYFPSHTKRATVAEEMSNGVLRKNFKNF